MGREGRETFGALLRRYRTAAGLSQDALAERAGVSRRGIADLERGARRFPYAHTVRSLADALDVGTLERAALVAAARPADTLTPVRSSLPSETSELIGRKRECSELQVLLKSVRLLTLTGTAGIGKTRLALEAACRSESQYEDGAIFVDLAPVADADLVAQASPLHRRTPTTCGLIVCRRSAGEPRDAPPCCF